MWRFVRRILKLAGLALLIAAMAIAGINGLVVWSTTSRVHRQLDQVPARTCALVLGASPILADGSRNAHFRNRVAAARDLFRAGRVQHILCSGDANGNYNEPGSMRRELVASGIPDAAILADEAGFRTLDSVIRARKVFHETSVVIVTDEFHAYRAVYSARHHGLDAVAFCSADIDWRWSSRTRLREYLARIAMFLDLYVLHTEPATLSREREDMRRARSELAR
jgi:SanA protein